MARESRARLRTPSPQNEKRPFKCSSSVIMCPSLTSHPLLPNACYLSKVRSTGLSCAKGLLENIYLISATTIDFRQFLPPRLLLVYVRDGSIGRYFQVPLNSKPEDLFPGLIHFLLSILSINPFIGKDLFSFPRTFEVQNCNAAIFI
jgi:hypothetical protein